MLVKIYNIIIYNYLYPTSYVLCRALPTVPFSSYHLDHIQSFHGGREETNELKSMVEAGTIGRVVRRGRPARLVQTVVPPNPTATYASITYEDKLHNLADTNAVPLALHVGVPY